MCRFAASRASGSGRRRPRRAPLEARPEPEPAPGTSGATRYRRVLLKISGEALAGPAAYGIDHGVLAAFAAELKDVHALGCELALVIGAEVIFKATRVDGVFDADPLKHPGAMRFEELTYIEVLSRQLQVMDATAISLCMDNGLPILVFNMMQPGNIKKAVTGMRIGTLVHGGRT